jgi:Acyl-CoA dehydrogenase, C-terminal domain
VPALLLVAELNFQIVQASTGLMWSAAALQVCMVFAQLVTGGTRHVPHVFVVRIRDDADRVAPGVRIEDCGPTMGLNGVDNGRLWFDRVRVPRDSLLDRYASVAPDGAYSSPIASVPARFGARPSLPRGVSVPTSRQSCSILMVMARSACVPGSLAMPIMTMTLCMCVALLPIQQICASITVGGLTNGRMLIAQSAVDSLKIGVTIAIRYALQRPQFGDRCIMTYVTHQLRLLPALADAYGLHLALGHLKSFAFSDAAVGTSEAAKSKAVHVMVSGLKAAATWLKVEGLQHCRECCGGQGFLAINKIGPMIADTNVDVTFEGDNTVMMQQVAKSLVNQAASSAAHGANEPLAPRLPGGVEALAVPADIAAASVMALLQYQYAPKLIALQWMLLMMCLQHVMWYNSVAKLLVQVRMCTCCQVWCWVSREKCTNATSCVERQCWHARAGKIVWRHRSQAPCVRQVTSAAYLARMLAARHVQPRLQKLSRPTWTSRSRQAGRMHSC